MDGVLKKLRKEKTNGKRQGRKYGINKVVVLYNASLPESM